MKPPLGQSFTPSSPGHLKIITSPLEISEKPFTNFSFEQGIEKPKLILLANKWSPTNKFGNIDFEGILKGWKKTYLMISAKKIAINIDLSVFKNLFFLKLLSKT